MSEALADLHGLADRVLGPQAKKDAEKYAMANKLAKADETASSGPVTVNLNEGQVPEYTRPQLAGQATAAQEQQAANAVAANTPSPAAPAPAPQPMQAAPPPQQGMMPVQQTVTGTVVPRGMLAKQEQIEKRALEAQDAATAASIQQNNAIAEHNKATALALAQHNKETADQQADIAQKQQEAAAEMQKKQDEYNAEKKIDPNRFTKRMGVGGNIMAIIGQSLGAYGAAMTHSPNYAQQMIEHAIDADIKAQESDIQARGQAVNMASNGVSMWRQRGLDNMASRAAEKLNLLQQSAAKIDELLASTKNPQLLAQGQQLKAGLEKSYNDTMMHYSQQQVSTVKTNPAAAGPQSMEDQLKLRALQVDVPQKDPATGKELPAKTFMAKSPQDAEKIRDALTVSRQIKSNLAEMKKLVKTTSQSISPSSKERVQKLDDTLRTQFAVLHHLGALSDKDYNIAGQLGDPTSLFQRDSTTMQLIDQYGSSLDSMVEGELRGRGLIK